MTGLDETQKFQACDVSSFQRICSTNPGEKTNIWKKYRRTVPLIAVATDGVLEGRGPRRSEHSEEMSSRSSGRFGVEGRAAPTATRRGVGRGAEAARRGLEGVRRKSKGGRGAPCVRDAQNNREGSFEKRGDGGRTGLLTSAAHSLLLRNHEPRSIFNQNMI